jgi:uncharacterized protein (TIGR03437 family)
MQVKLFFSSLLLAAASQAQTYVISTVAGSGAPVTPTAATQASIGDPARLATDAAGNVYFGSFHSIFKIDPAGNMTRVAGNGRAGYSGDGALATDAQFLNPMGMAFDSAGALYVADRDANVVRKIRPDGVIVTAAGAEGQLRGPFGVAVNADGTIYVSDTGNQRIARFSATGQYLGSAGDGFLNGPEGIAIDSAGNVYIADTFNGRIRKFDPDGTLTTVAGTGSTGVYGGDNNPAIGAAISLPTDVAVDRNGNLYIADFGNDRVRSVVNGIMSTVAGAPNAPPLTDGQEAVNARFVGPTGVTVDRNGNLYIVEAGIGSGTGLARGDFKIYKVNSQGIITTFAGSGQSSYSGDGGQALRAQLNAPAGVTVDSAGNIYIADTINDRIRVVALNGAISTAAGTGVHGFLGDSTSPLTAQMKSPSGVAVDSLGRIFIADTDNSRVRRVDPGGNIATIAGNGNASYFGDGLQARSASVNHPEGVAVDSAGNVYVADTLDNAIRKITTDGVITTVAGFGTPGFSGDGGPATKAALDHPRGVAVDAAGNIYIADTGNNRVRKVDFLGNITTVADRLSGPRGVAVDRNGVLYIADTGHNQVLRDNVIIAGNGACCYSGDGDFATAARLNGPAGISVDAAGSVYVADAGNNAVRVLRPVSANIGLTAILNAASNRPGAVAPGEIVAIFGAGLLGTKSVLFNGIPAPVLYSTDTQIGAIVPYALTASNLQVVAQTPVATSAPLPSTLTAIAPGIFTTDGSGAGQAVAVNPDGSPNKASTPAAAGSIISLLVTGEGQTSPAGVDGKLAGSPAPTPLAPVIVSIGGIPASLKYAGGAPGAIAGLMQVNAVIPDGLSGNVPVVISVGGVSSQPGVTIAVK